MTRAVRRLVQTLCSRKTAERVCQQAKEFPTFRCAKIPGRRTIPLGPPRLPGSRATSRASLSRSRCLPCLPIATCDRKFHVDSGVVALLIFDFSLSKRGLRAGAPENRLLRLINETFFNQDSKRAQNFRF